MWRINDDDFLGQLGEAVADVGAVRLGWPARRKKPETVAEAEIWLAPAREDEPGQRRTATPRLRTRP
jgi:hypothetical protein